MEQLKNTIKKILNSKTAKNGAWIYLLQIFNTVIPMITLPYITRILGSEMFGVFSIAVNIYGYMQVVVEYGFGMSSTRKVALMSDNDSDLGRMFTSVFFSRVLLMALCVIFTVIYSLFRTDSAQLISSLWILTIGLIGYVVQQNYLFQGKQDMKYIAIINVMARSISTILIFLLVKTTDDIILYSILYAVSPIISGFLGVLISMKKYKVHLVRITMKEVIDEIRDGFYVFTTQMSSKVFGAIGVTILGIYGTFSEIGAFSAIQKIASVMIFAWSPIGLVIYPEVSRRMSVSFESGVSFVRLIRKYILALFIAMALFTSLLSRQLVMIAFGPEYVQYAAWLIPLSIWVIISINNNFLGTQILLSSGHDKAYSKVFQIGVAITVILNFVLIYFLRGWGAAVAPMLSDLALWVMLQKEVNRLVREELG